jgi:integral membrane protein
MTAPEPAVTTDAVTTDAATTPAVTTNAATTNEENPARDAAAPGLKGALARYRVAAYVVGVGLLALCAAMVLNYGFDQPQYSRIVGPVHGFLYVVYLGLTVDLGLKARWPMTRTVLILLAGMVPFVSFIAERKVTRDLAQAHGRDSRPA